MPEQTSREDLNGRLALIEAMIAEGRRTTESWGWRYILWGVAFYVAIAWTAWAHSGWAWPITMVAAMAVSLIAGSFKPGQRAQTSLTRSIRSVWDAFGISAFLIFMSLGFAGRVTDARIFIAVFAGMLGMANAASGLTLRWKPQLACAAVWWVAAAAACFVTPRQALIILLVAIFLGQIAFGIYGMVRMGAGKSQRGAAHA